MTTLHQLINYKYSLAKAQQEACDRCKTPPAIILVTSNEKATQRPTGCRRAENMSWDNSFMGI